MSAQVRGSSKLTPEEDAAMKEQLDALSLQGNLFSPWKDCIQDQTNLPGLEDLKYIGRDSCGRLVVTATPWMFSEEDKGTQR
jgi:hypothetical protein